MTTTTYTITELEAMNEREFDYALDRIERQAERGHRQARRVLGEIDRRIARFGTF